ncbi:hypothetical protein B0H69_004527 [Clostridium beijerinckii]|nr:hypothetical protein [Clostridium beijerinckii]NRU50480.1 hypothetical protein [Clostridium beijerinckii]NRZ31523.1 hypothetical protein [Clostridium beijerinckii]NSA10735.1 hypothetical protein [Clostridium beijerinckii]NSA60553.1 hypothetical protein [Clostridium beijerinckii]
MFINCSLMLTLIIASIGQTSVEDVINKLYEGGGHEVFK